MFPPRWPEEPQLAALHDVTRHTTYILFECPTTMILHPHAICFPVAGPIAALRLGFFTLRSTITLRLLRNTPPHILEIGLSLKRDRHCCWRGFLSVLKVDQGQNFSLILSNRRSPHSTTSCTLKYIWPTPVDLSFIASTIKEL